MSRISIFFLELFGVPPILKITGQNGGDLNTYVVEWDLQCRKVKVYRDHHLELCDDCVT